jgi:hypothetical protein
VEKPAGTILCRTLELAFAAVYVWDIPHGRLVGIIATVI